MCQSVYLSARTGTEKVLIRTWYKLNLGMTTCCGKSQKWLDFGNIWPWPTIFWPSEMVHYFDATSHVWELVAWWEVPERQRCVRDKALYKSTFTLPYLTLPYLTLLALTATSWGQVQISQIGDIGWLGSILDERSKLPSMTEKNNPDCVGGASEFRARHWWQRACFPYTYSFIIIS